MTLMDVIRTFEDLSPAAGDRREPGDLTPVGRALGAVLSEIDEIAKATFGSISLATMLRLIERQQRNQADAQTRPPNNRASTSESSRGAKPKRGARP
jgi:hypothetical protein